MKLLAFAFYLYFSQRDRLFTMSRYESKQNRKEKKMNQEWIKNNVSSNQRKHIKHTHSP